MSAILFETLERRALFAATVVPASVGLDGATLEIRASPKVASVIEIHTDQEGQEFVVRVTGLSPQTFSRYDIASIHIVGSRGRDRITLREEFGLIDLPILIEAGSGNDYVDLDYSPATVRGGNGNDTLLGSDGDDVLNGNDQNDKVFAGPGDDTLGGGSGNDDLRADAGDDVLRGERGNDTLDGGSGSDWLDGGEGRNRLVDRAARGERNTFYGSFYRNDAQNRIYGSRSDNYYEIDWWYDRVYFSNQRVLSLD